MMVLKSGRSADRATNRSANVPTEVARKPTDFVPRRPGSVWPAPSYSLNGTFLDSATPPLSLGLGVGLRRNASAEWTNQSSCAQSFLVTTGVTQWRRSSLLLL